MAILYTAKQIQEVLRELRIKPADGKVTTREAARILTWRAKAEHNVAHEYPDSAVRRHVQQGNLKIAQQINARFNLYRVEDVFDLQLAPRRGIGQQKEAKEEAA
ncbi:MAG TPA: hypothetical protein VEL31_04990 [Ktedonobacteraceae bacterium]|nr:hypothetical protein [Ktedonobacteraceae bacterium]